jgi:hypothetical protein
MRKKSTQEFSKTLAGAPAPPTIGARACASPLKRLPHLLAVYFPGLRPLRRDGSEDRDTMAKAGFGHLLCVTRWDMIPMILESHSAGRGARLLPFRHSQVSDGEGASWWRTTSPTMFVLNLLQRRRVSAVGRVQELAAITSRRPCITRGRAATCTACSRVPRGAFEAAKADVVVVGHTHRACAIRPTAGSASSRRRARSACSSCRRSAGR